VADYCSAVLLARDRFLLACFDIFIPPTATSPIAVLLCPDFAL